MKKLNSELIDVVESFGVMKGSWNIIENKYGRNKLTEKVSFYQYKDRLFCVIDRTGDKPVSQLIEYENKEEGNQHFNQMKLMVTALNGYLIHDKRSGC